MKVNSCHIPNRSFTTFGPSVASRNLRSISSPYGVSRHVGSLSLCLYPYIITVTKTYINIGLETVYLWIISYILVIIINLLFNTWA